MSRTEPSTLAKGAAATVSAVVFIALLAQAQGGCDSDAPAGGASTPAESAEPSPDGAAPKEASPGEVEPSPVEPAKVEPVEAASAKVEPSKPEPAEVEAPNPLRFGTVGDPTGRANANPKKKDDSQIFLGSSKSDPDIWTRGDLAEGLVPAQVEEVEDGEDEGEPRS